MLMTLNLLSLLLSPVLFFMGAAAMVILLSNFNLFTSDDDMTS